MPANKIGHACKQETAFKRPGLRTQHPINDSAQRVHHLTFPFEGQRVVTLVPCMPPLVFTKTLPL